jgi:hypothetical protein
MYDSAVVFQTVAGNLCVLWLHQFYLSHWLPYHKKKMNLLKILFMINAGNFFAS